MYACSHEPMHARKYEQHMCRLSHMETCSDVHDTEVLCVWLNRRPTITCRRISHTSSLSPASTFLPNGRDTGVPSHLKLTFHRTIKADDL